MMPKKRVETTKQNLFPCKSTKMIALNTLSLFLVLKMNLPMKPFSSDIEVEMIILKVVDFCNTFFLSRKAEVKKKKENKR